MFRAIKNLVLNTYLELANPTVRIEKDVHIQTSAVWRGSIRFGRRVRLVRASALYGTITLGDYSYVNALVELQGGAVHGITIGKFCSLGRNVFISATNNHRPETASTYPIAENVLGTPGVDVGAPVTIGNDVWVGANAVILSGVTIGDGAVIGAGAVVPSGTVIPAYEMWGGVPAHKIKDRFSAATRERIQKLGWWHWPEEKIKQQRELFTSAQ